MRGDLLARLGRPDESRAEFEAAAALTRNERERALLLERAARPEPRAQAGVSPSPDALVRHHGRRWRHA